MKIKVALSISLSIQTISQWHHSPMNNATTPSALKMFPPREFPLCALLNVIIKWDSICMSQLWTCHFAYQMRIHTLLPPWTLGISSKYSHPYCLGLHHLCVIIFVSIGESIIIHCTLRSYLYGLPRSMMLQPLWVDTPRISNTSQQSRARGSNLTHHLFLYSPWAKHVLYIF